MRGWIESVITGRRMGSGAHCYRALTTPLSWLYAAIIGGRNQLYHWGLLPQYKIDAPVISIGNIVCGGVGKTQVALLLTRELEKQGKRVAILLRGYGAAGKLQQVECATMTPQECGDEPWMLANRLPQAVVVVGKNRLQGAQLALSKGADVLILDDGLQHRKLARTVEIIVVDGAHPLGQGGFLPKGMLRDTPRRLDEADMVISIGELKERLSVTCPVVQMEIAPEGIFSMEGKKYERVQKVGLFCGIGNPVRFVQTVQKMGCEVVASAFLADHATPPLKQLHALAQTSVARGADLLLCTEKDKVKLSASLRLPLPLGWVKSELKIVHNAEAWHTICEKAITKGDL